MQDETNRKLHELAVTLDAHTDFLNFLITQQTVNSARQQTILSVLREILAKHGIDQATSQKMCDELFARLLVAEQSLSAQALESADTSRPPSSLGADSEKN